MPLHGSRDSTAYGYGHAGLGAIRHRTTGTRLTADSITGEVTPSEFSDTDTRFAATLGIGVVLPLATGVGLDLNANVDFVWTKVYRIDDPGDTSYAAKGYSVDLAAGIVLFL